MISAKIIAYSISILAVITSGFIVSAIVTATSVQAYSLSHESQGLTSKNSNKSNNEVRQFAINQNQSDPSNATAKDVNTVVQFGSNQDPTHGTVDYATISKSDPKAQFGSNQDPTHGTVDYATISKSDPKAQFGSNQN